MCKFTTNFMFSGTKPSIVSSSVNFCAYSLMCQLDLQQQQQETAWFFI